MCNRNSKPNGVREPSSKTLRVFGQHEHPAEVRIKNLLMPLFLMGCFPVDFQDVKRPLRTKSVKRPIKVGKRPINEGKRPIKAKVLVGVSVGSLMGCFRAPPTWRKTAPLKRPIKRSMSGVNFFSVFLWQGCREVCREFLVKFTAG